MSFSVPDTGNLSISAVTIMSLVRGLRENLWIIELRAFHMDS